MDRREAARAAAIKRAKTERLTIKRGGRKLETTARDHRRPETR